MLPLKLSIAQAWLAHSKIMADPQPWQHRPAHVFVPNTVYMVTGSTLHKTPVFCGSERLRILENSLFQSAETYGWKLEAWAIFPHHYHWIGKSPGDGATLRKLIQRLHSQSARETNRLDGTPGRMIWFQYWDTCLTYEKSYYARLNYVHHNPIKHKWAEEPEKYPYCSAAWFKSMADPEYYRKITSYRFDKVNIEDDF